MRLETQEVDGDRVAGGVVGFAVREAGAVFAVDVEECAVVFVG